MVFKWKRHLEACINYKHKHKHMVPGLEPNARNAGEKRLAAGGCLQACTGKDRVSSTPAELQLCAQAR